MRFPSKPCSPLAEAIDEFLEEMKARDRKGRFYEEVLNSRAVMAVSEGQKGVNECAGKLTEFVKQIEQRGHSSKTTRVLLAIGPFMDGLQNLMSACQTMIQASPFAVGVVFTGAQLVLRLAQKMGKALDVITEAMAEIGASLKCYGKFAVAYETSDEVRERLVASYKNIVKFWATATKLLDQNLIIGTLKNILNPLADEIQGTLDSLRRDCSRVESIAHAEEAVRANEDRKRLKAEHEEKLKNGIRDWISAGDDLDVRCDLEFHSERRHGTTCSWIFEDKKFLHWRDSTSDPILWYNAPPGSGKTVLSSAVVQHLSERGLPSAYFFYSFSDFTKRNPLTGLKALTLQILNILKTGIPDRVVELYRQEMAHNARHLRLRGHVIEILHALLKQCPLIYILVDGLDESLDDENMRATLSSIISAPVYGTVRWFFTSRKEGQIHSMMENLNAVFLSPARSTLAAEIKLFLADGLRSIAKSLEQIDDYVEYSEGSFLYSKFLIDTLNGKGVTCDTDIKAALHEFPQTLTGYYMRSLLRLSYRSPPERDLVRRLFTILVTAVQSITWNELRNALAIRPGARDYSPDSVPKEDAIHDLCGSLLLFDRSSEQNKTNAKVKLFHKTIQDFLLQDPRDLPIDKSFSHVEEFRLKEMKKFFVQPSEGSVKFGLTCMTLLQYRRYKSFSAAKAILDDDSTENAFLKYAAAFWFLHFMDTEHHSEEIFEEVRAFMESASFWTCVALQSYIVPYNFGRYARTGAKKYQMGVRRADWSKADCFAVPLPNWLGQYPYGKLLDQDFCSFVSDWHEALASRPGTLDQCVPLSNMQSRLGNHLHQSEGIKVWRLNDKIDPANAAQLRVSSISLSGAKLLAELVCKYLSDPPGRIHYHRVSVFSKGTKIHGTFDKGTPLTDLDSIDTDFQLVRNDSQVRLLKFDGSRLQLERSLDGISQKFSAPGAWKAAVPSQSWQLRSKCNRNTPHGKLTLFHVVRNTHQSVNPKHDDSDSSDSDSDSCSDSSSESESDDGTIVDSHYDSGYEEGSSAKSKPRSVEQLPNECAIIIWESSQPLWIPIALNKGARKEIPFAVHPSLPFVVLKDLNGHVLIANMGTGIWSTETDSFLLDGKGCQGKLLPFLSPDTLFDGLTSVASEIHFSSCGQFLYSLQACFREQEGHAECALSLSTSRFTTNEAGSSSLDEPRIHQQITYKMKEPIDSLPANLVLVHWSDSEVVVALPPLTCEPKIVKFGLSRPSNSGPDTLWSAETLRTPIYFPSSAIVSNPVLLYRHRSSSKDHELFLALTEKNSASHPTDVGEQETSHVPSPVVIRWKIPHKDGWRLWDSEIDEESEDLKRGIDDMRILRGGFVDGDKRFYVPIRSGLDWTRSGYLTCC
ncbi:uncharacterized protein N7496_006971 [Penicillium cataractarum]|uniref:NACHT domain-containing protein n=1 Tax=Penicillium cataractarum TaxID=2100454 RepID=A0A9W9S589_9EURO|nr:uncharacterized protein N7496_006971 [Penicillium cataractarum]KAJ5370879.1 hypothetical protein N7496_006971 [Penicillium cataractarum]